MFNINKYDTQKEIWEEPSLIDEVEDKTEDDDNKSEVGLVYGDGLNEKAEAIRVEEDERTIRNLNDPRKSTQAGIEAHCHLHLLSQAVSNLRKSEG